MSSIYGNAFLNIYGETDSGIWYDVLHTLSEEELENGYQAIIDLKFKPLDFPPNPLRFKEICIEETKAKNVNHENNRLRAEFHHGNADEKIGSFISHLRQDKGGRSFTFAGVISGDELRETLSPQEIKAAYDNFKEYAKIPMWLFCKYVTFCAKGKGDINDFCMKNKIDIGGWS